MNNIPSTQKDAAPNLGRFKLAERDRAQAKIFREVIGPASVAATPASQGPVAPLITPHVRQQLLAEAISRDPSLAQASDSETLRRLAESMADLEREHGLKWELAQLREAQAAAARATARAERAEADRLLVAQVRERTSIEEERIAARVDELAAAKPLPGWMATHKPQVAAVAAILAVGVIGGVIALTRPPTAVSAGDAVASSSPAPSTASPAMATPTPSPSTRTDGKVSAKYQSAAACTSLYGSAGNWGTKLGTGSAVRWNYYVEQVCALTPDPQLGGDEILMLYSTYNKKVALHGVSTARSRDGRGAIQWDDHRLDLTTSQRQWVRAQAERAAGRLAA